MIEQRKSLSDLAATSMNIDTNNAPLLNGQIDTSPNNSTDLNEFAENTFDNEMPLENQLSDDFGSIDGGIGEFEEQVDYTTYIRKIMRFETKGLTKLTKGEKEELKGEFCFIEDYNDETKIFKVQVLGNEEEYDLILPEVVLTHVEYGKLPNEVKELLKLYRKSYGKYEGTRKYLSRLYTKLVDTSSELRQLLGQIHQIGVSTFPTTLERAKRSNQEGYADFQPTSTNTMFGNQNQQMSMLSNNSITSKNSGLGLFGNKREVNQDAHKGWSNPSFNNGIYSRNNTPSSPLSTTADKEGFQTYKKNLLGNEKLVRERNKRGKLKKKAKMLLKPNHIYYIKLTTGAVLMIYVKSEEYAPKKYRRQYYSEFGMVEPREIASFIEKESNEPGTEKLKEFYRRVFTLEKSIDRMESKKAEKDTELKQWEVRRDGYRGLLNEYLLKGIKRREVTKCGRKEIDFSVVKEGNVKMFAITNIEYDVFTYLYKKYKGYLPTIRYVKDKKLLIVPINIGVRRIEMSKLLKELIKVYGHKDSKELYEKHTLLINHYL